MKKVDAKFVIGANYGDEGKGLATNFFAQNASNKVINILFNGGSQRGHTVELKDGTRHVFHHFGSGTFAGADTFFDVHFIVNPMNFVKEYCELVDLGYKPVCYINPNCRVTTPFDVFINQIVEHGRGNKRHGSCGCGIWETIKRYNNPNFCCDFGNDRGKFRDKFGMSYMSNSQLTDFLKELAEDYLPTVLSHDYSIDNIPSEFKEIINDRSLIEHWIDDFRFMQSVCTPARMKDIINLDDNISLIYEAGQGLALGEQQVHPDNWEHSTPSNTGSDSQIYRLYNMLNRTTCEYSVEICYVTRSYFTRHGNGPFDECSKNEINPDIEDNTNVPNEFQGSIRYGKFNKNDFLSRVSEDIKYIPNDFPVKKSLMITHLNYTDGDIFGDCKIDDLTLGFDKFYKSYTKFSEDIITS